MYAEYRPTKHMTVEAHKETLGFQAEVQQLLRLVDPFFVFPQGSLPPRTDLQRLRRLRQAALRGADRWRAVRERSDLKIRVSFDKDARTITVSDNGIGMDRQEVIDNIGTIARSGTRQFMQKLTGDQAKDANLIGQFGVGFYSSFIVADKVTLLTRRAGMGRSTGCCGSPPAKANTPWRRWTRPTRGTEVTLHLREDESDLLNEWQLRSIITKYSDHITLPVLMPVQKFSEDKDAPPTIEEERINQAAALWARPKQEIKEEEYQEFYKHVGHDFEDPLAWTHNRVEGKLEYTSLLFIPAAPPSICGIATAPRGEAVRAAGVHHG
jgi:molecular chaperone HtpG